MIHIRAVALEIHDGGLYRLWTMRETSHANLQKYLKLQCSAISRRDAWQNTFNS